LLLTTTQTGKVYFEARIATTSVAANTGQIFCGLGEVQVLGTTGFTASVPLGNANATANSLAMVGFNRLENGTTNLNTSYADHATSWTDVQALAYTGLAANTWIKLGIKIDFADTARCVRFFVDGIEQTTAMTKAALLALTYLDVSCLGPMLAMYADSATSTTDYLYMDWWQIAQNFES
jgi:hypothetical protein